MTIAEWLEEKGRKQGQQEGEQEATREHRPPECWRAASNVKPCRSSPG